MEAMRNQMSSQTDFSMGRQDLLNQIQSGRVSLLNESPASNNLQQRPGMNTGVGMGMDMDMMNMRMPIDRGMSMGMDRGMSMDMGMGIE